MNIAEILKNKPQGTKLNTPIFGDVTFDKVEKDLGEYTIFVTDKGQNHQTFMADGSYNRNGVPMLYGVPVLFPSKEMRDWTKFAWKKGDVLVSNDGKKEIIFDSFTTSNYTCFKGRHYLDCSDENNQKYKEEISIFTHLYNLEDKDAAQCYINTIEEKLNGKLNMETLEIVPNKSTEPKFKPFDKVVARCDGESWRAEIFSHADYKSYCCIGGWYDEVLPYNEETAKLIGTSNDYKED